MAKSKLDQEIFEKIKVHAEEVESQYGERNDLFEELERMYLMDWTDKPTASDVKVTISPDARNAIQGAVRLMTATDPQFIVPGDKSQRNEEESKIEQAAAAIWDRAGEIQQSPIHYDAMLSSLLYGEVHIPITNTNSLVKFAKENKMGQDRAEQLAAMTPFLFEVWNPMDGYPEFDALGLCAYYRKATVRVGTLRTRFGEAVEEVVKGKKSGDTVELSMFYDLENYGVWVEDTGIIAEEHGLPFIPVSVTVTEGSKMFQDMKYTRQPMLYGLHKSGLWERQNLTQTVLFTHLYQLGINPTTVTYTKDGKAPDRDYAGGQINMKIGERIEHITNKGIIDPSFGVAMDIINSKTEASTIYSQALGQPMGGSPAFSTVALLSQSGRLPLIATQKRGGWAIADAMRKALNWYKQDGQDCPGIDLKPSDIKDNLQLEVKLDVSLPQDKLQMANIANLITQGDDPLSTKEWARENILNIGQSAEMTEDIWAEKGANALNSMFLQGQVQALMQKAMEEEQKKMVNANPQDMPPEGPPPEMQGMNAGAGMPEGQGQMVQGGLPPQQAGMIPGQGQAAAPPEGMV